MQRRIDKLDMHAQGVWKHSTAWLGSFGRRWAARAPAARRARGAQAAADTAVRELARACRRAALLLLQLEYQMLSV